jgi:hypothetical protein
VEQMWNIGVFARTDDGPDLHFRVKTIAEPFDYEREFAQHAL